MALTIVERPTGHILSTSFPATVSNDSGEAVFTKASAHGISTGSTVYVTSNVRDYAEFWTYVEAFTANSLKLRKYSSDSNVDYVNNDTVTVYTSPFGHPWNAVHLPIVYKITSDLWPVNTVDTVRTVLSSSNSFGYTKLVLSGDIKATGSANELDFVKLAVNGVENIYQILQWISDTNFVIDLPFVGTNTYGNIQFYYSNYHARIKIYAGLTGTHTWSPQKPYQYITELKEVPDSDNIVMVNIAEYVKSQIKVLSNDLLLGTLPNDIDSIAYFYISVAESYDISLDGYTIGSYESAFADDSSNFEGIASNSKLPFRNRYSGFMTDYVGASRKFLTMFSQPTIFNGYWFEMGVIISDETVSGAIIFVQQTYKNGVLQASYETPLSSAPANVGVYRIPLTVKGTEDQQYAFLAAVGGGPSYATRYSETKVINVNSKCGAQATQFIWKVWTGGYDTFVFTSQKDYGIDIKGAEQSQKSFMGDWPESYGENADTINREIQRETNETLTIYSQNVTETEINGLKFLKTSPLVQVMNSKFDKRTVIIDQASFVVKTDGAKLYSITFKASFTDNVPSQSL